MQSVDRWLGTPERLSPEGMEPEIGRRIRGIICCPTGDSLRYPDATRLWRRVQRRLVDSRHRRAAVSRALELFDGLATSPSNQLIIIGPGVDRRLGVRITDSHGAVIDFSGSRARSTDPKRRSLDEGWFNLAKPATDLALDEIARALPAPWAREVAAHRKALQLRLKMEVGLRLRRLEIVKSAQTLASHPDIVIIEGDQPMDDVALHLAGPGVRIETVIAPTSPLAWLRAVARPSAMQPSDANWQAFSDAITAWTPPLADLADKVVIAADLRKETDFRHSRTTLALMTEALTRNEQAVLLQPHTRITRNVLRAMRAAHRVGAEVCLRRQPTLQAASPELAGVRSLLLQAVDSKLHELDRMTVGARGAILEACGSFVISNLPQSLGLCRGLEQSFSAAPPKFVASVPLGSPFGALVVSAARRAKVPTIEVQTLMIGTSQRDPEPVADKVAVLDTQQQGIFSRRFGVSADRFVLSGHVDLPSAPLPPIREPSVLFASQPLDKVSVAALELLAAGCAAAKHARLRVAPHPDETDEDLEAYRRVLDAWPDLDSAVMARGSASAALQTHGVLATVVSNMALWAAAQERNVITVDVGVPVPIDFAAMGVAARASTPSQVSDLLNDFARAGPLSAALAESRQAYFDRNSQLRDGRVGRRIMDAMDEMRRNRVI